MPLAVWRRAVDAGSEQEWWDNLPRLEEGIETVVHQARTELAGLLRQQAERRRASQDTERGRLVRQGGSSLCWGWLPILGLERNVDAGVALQHIGRGKTPCSWVVVAGMDLQRNPRSGRFGGIASLRQSRSWRPSKWKLTPWISKSS